MGKQTKKAFPQPKVQKQTDYEKVKLAIAQPQGDDDFNAADLIQTLEEEGMQVDALKSQFLRINEKTTIVSEPDTKASKQLQERRVAAIVMKQNVKKWLPIIKKNREAESINFAKAKSLPAKKISDVSTALVHNPIAQQVESAMETVEMKQPEQLKRTSVKSSGVQFYHELKLNKLNTIKSKIYKSLKKKKSQKDKIKLLSQLNPEERRKEIEKIKVERAKERVTLRHSTKNKFISQLLRFGGDQKSSKQQQTYLNNLKQQLLSKFDINDEEVDFDEDNFKEQALNELEKELREIELQAKHQQQSSSFGFLEKKNQKVLKQSRTLVEQLINVLKSENVEGVMEEEPQEQDQEEGCEEDQKKGNDKPETFEGRAKFQSVVVPNQKVAQKQSVFDAKQVLQSAYKQAVNGKPEGEIAKVDKANAKMQLIQGIQISNLKDKYQQVNDKKKYDFHDIDHDDEQNVKATLENFHLALDDIQDSNNMDENLKEFQEEKLRELEGQIEPEVKPLKGWGSWTGIGIKDRKAPSEEMLLQRKIQKIKELQKQRQDRNLDNVIISEKRDAKFCQKYLVQKLPHEFTSTEQFDHFTANPIGPEWNLLQSHQELVRPKVITKAGHVITPIRLPNQIQKLVN